MKKLTSTLLIVLLSYYIPLTCLHAESDTPSPQILKETASTLRDEVNTLAREYRKASDGKNGGVAPATKQSTKRFFPTATNCKPLRKCVPLANLQSAY